MNLTVKSAEMQLAEIRHGEHLESLLPRLYDELKNWGLVAERLGVTRMTTHRWRDALGIKDADFTDPNHTTD